MPRATFFEYCVQETALNQALTRERFPVVNGLVAVPTGPGLGVEIDDEVLSVHAVDG